MQSKGWKCSNAHICVDAVSFSWIIQNYHSELKAVSLNDSPTSDAI